LRLASSVIVRRVAIEELFEQASTVTARLSAMSVWALWENLKQNIEDQIRAYIDSVEDTTRELPDCPAEQMTLEQLHDLDAVNDAMGQAIDDVLWGRAEWIQDLIIQRRLLEKRLERAKKPKT
jgi:hypothetical protein